MSSSVLILLGLLAVGQSPRDRPVDPARRVHDFAGILPQDRASQLDQLARDVQRETTAQLAIVTVESLEGMTVDDYANELFNRWGIGDRDRNNGVLILVAPRERRYRIEVGTGLEPLLTDALCGAIGADAMAPEFRRGDYAAGIERGARAVADVLRGDPQAARGVVGTAPRDRRAARQRAWRSAGAAAVAGIVLGLLAVGAKVRRGLSTWLFAVAAAAAALLLGLAVLAALAVPPAQGAWFGVAGAGAASAAGLAALWRMYRRYGPHPCPKCGTRLELLCETSDDEKLSEVQRLEEKIGSVDYDVWFCHACLIADTERYINWFSSFQDCPSCRHRTFKEEAQRVVRPASTVASGLAIVDGRCISCLHDRQRSVILPRIVASTSGSGSSLGGGGGFGGGGGGGFGGGSSGGGGASGGW